MSSTCGWCRPHAAWAVPLLFPGFFVTVGTVSVLQGFAEHFCGESAEWCLNLPPTATGLIALFAAPWLGALSDRIGRKKVLLGVATVGLLPPLALVVWGYWGFLLASCLNPAASAAGIVFAYVADTTPPEKRSMMIGIVMAIGGSTAWVLGPLFWTFILEEYGFDGFRWALLACCCGPLAIVAIVPESLPSGERSEPVRRQRSRMSNMLPWCRSFRLLTGHGPFADSASQLRVMFFVLLLLYGVKSGLVLSLGLFATEIAGLTYTQRSRMQICFGLAQLAGQLLIGPLLQVLSHRSLVCAGVLLALVASAIPAVPGITAPWFYLAEVLLALSFVSYVVTISMASKAVPSKFVGEVTSVMASTLSITAAFGPLLFAFLTSAFQRTAYPGGVMLLFSAVIFGALVLSFRLPKDDDIGKTGSQSMIGTSLQPQSAS